MGKNKGKGRDKNFNKTAVLPQPLAERLAVQLGPDGLRDFLACLQEEPRGGLRFNTGKAAAEALLDLLPFPLEPIPWAASGYVYPQEARPGKLPYYQAGLYYLQEPSAMAPAASLGVRPGERVLDLCAAPGGKTTQLAAALAGKGLLVANDNSPKRIKPLIWNLEHWGVTNYIVTNEEPARLAKAFPVFFDKILVDAPCSGEGMLRKDAKALKSWQSFNGQVCRQMQDQILDQAAIMLAAGGRLLYSTCTFNPLENDEAVAAFLDRHPDFGLVPLPFYEGWRGGGQLEECRQLWPHLVEGEGQFLALLEKKGAENCRASVIGTETAVKATALPPKTFAEGALAPFLEFMAENFTYPLPGPFALYDGHVYQVPAGLPDLAGLKLGRPGWYLGMIKHGRFSPSQPLAMGIPASQMKRRLDLLPQDELVERYLRGETLMVEGVPGWTLVTLAGYPLGFGKQTGDYLKNEYPAGWRLY